MIQSSGTAPIFCCFVCFWCLCYFSLLFKLEYNPSFTSHWLLCDVYMFSLAFSFMCVCVCGSVCVCIEMHEQKKPFKGQNNLFTKCLADERHLNLPKEKCNRKVSRFDYKIKLVCPPSCLDTHCQNCYANSSEVPISSLFVHGSCLEHFHCVRPKCPCQRNGTFCPAELQLVHFSAPGKRNNEVHGACSPREL